MFLSPLGERLGEEVYAAFDALHLTVTCGQSAKARRLVPFYLV